MAFKTYIETNGALLHISGKYQPRWDGKEFEFKILKIDLLSPIVRSKLRQSTHPASIGFMDDVNDKLVE